MRDASSPRQHYWPRLEPTLAAFTALDWLAPDLRDLVVPWFSTALQAEPVVVTLLVRMIEGFGAIALSSPDPDTVSIHTTLGEDPSPTRRLTVVRALDFEHTAGLVEQRAIDDDDVLAIDVGHLSGNSAVDDLIVRGVLRRVGGTAPREVVLVADDFAEDDLSGRHAVRPGAVTYRSVGLDTSLSFADRPPQLVDLRQPLVAYSTDDGWRLFSTRSTRSSFRDLTAIAQQIVESRDFRGVEFSAGDAWLAAVADTVADPLDELCWSAAVACHHMTVVAEMIQTCEPFSAHARLRAGPTPRH
jgi:hypothetical protein